MKINDPINSQMNIKLTYPYSDEFEYDTFLKRINLDDTRLTDFKTGKGFAIQTSKSIKGDIKNQLGIFSNRFGSTIDNVDSFNGKYRCRCGHTKGSIMHGEVCPICGTIVKFYDDDVSIFGWLLLKNDYFVIHPNIYRTLEAFIGATRLGRIIEPEVQVNSDGAIVSIGIPKKDEPFKGIGMLNFRERYDEILNYYLAKNPGKQAIYDSLVENKSLTFSRSIPVFSALLRPYSLDGSQCLRYDACNDYFMMLSRLVSEINRNAFHMDTKIKEKLALLYDAQVQFNNVYEELKECLSKKKGDIRSFGLLIIVI